MTTITTEENESMIAYEIGCKKATKKDQTYYYIVNVLSTTSSWPLDKHLVITYS